MVAVFVWVGIAAGGPVVWVADQRVWMGILLRDVSRGGGYKDKGERVSALWERGGGDWLVREGLVRFVLGKRVWRCGGCGALNPFAEETM